MCTIASPHTLYDHIICVMILEYFDHYNAANKSKQQLQVVTLGTKTSTIIAVAPTKKPKLVNAVYRLSRSATKMLKMKMIISTKLLMYVAKTISW